MRCGGGSPDIEPPLRYLGSACVLRREAADRRPIEGVIALREGPEKSVVQKPAERHGDAQRFGGRQGKADVLESERCVEPCRLRSRSERLQVRASLRYLFARDPKAAIDAALRFQT